MAEQQQMSASKLADSFNAYRRNFEEPGRATSIESEGIFEPEVFEAVIGDPRTTTITTEAGTVPLLTPLENLSSWFNIGFYKRLNGMRTDSEIVAYNYLPAAEAVDPGKYAQTVGTRLLELAQARGVLAVDHTDHRAAELTTHLDSLYMHAGVEVTDLVLQSDIDALHYHYASKTESPGASRDAPAAEAFYEGYDDLQLPGSPDSQRSTTVHAALEQSEIDTIWDFYKPAFDVLSHDDPVYAGFSRDEMQDIMSSPDFIKIIHRSGDDIVNLCLVADIAYTPWINGAYFRDRYPREYDNQQVLCCVGIIANPNVSQRGSSMYTISMVGQVVKQAQISPVITFACDALSNQNVPVIAERSLARVGVSSDYTNPVGHQVFRALQLAPVAQHR